MKNESIKKETTLLIISAKNTSTKKPKTSNWKPSSNHPWRKFKFSKKEVKNHYI